MPNCHYNKGANALVFIQFIYFFYCADTFDAKAKNNTSYFALLSEACIRTIYISYFFSFWSEI